MTRRKTTVQTAKNSHHRSLMRLACGPAGSSVDCMPVQPETYKVKYRITNERGGREVFTFPFAILHFSFLILHSLLRLFRALRKVGVCALAFGTKPVMSPQI
jgi:hypothetical protein